jgi:predicted methyltransferase
MQVPLLTADILELLLLARRQGLATIDCSLDLKRSITKVEIHADQWQWQQSKFPYPEQLNDRTVYFWNGESFQAVSRFGGSLIKLVPTQWGAPTFEIDGIKMLPTAKVSPFADAGNKVNLIRPRAKVILDCCAGLGYFAAWCKSGGAKQILSFEKNPDVLWMRTLNPWSPGPDATLSLTLADITQAVLELPNEAVDAVLHDPPRFGIAGELYSQSFYVELARVLKPNGLLFHYTGSPNKVSSGRDLAGEVTQRLRMAGFESQRQGDGILASKQRERRARPM